MICHNSSRTWTRRGLWGGTSTTCAPRCKRCTRQWQRGRCASAYLWFRTQIFEEFLSFPICLQTQQLLKDLEWKPICPLHSAKGKIWTEAIQVPSYICCALEIVHVITRGLFPWEGAKTHYFPKKHTSYFSQFSQGQPDRAAGQRLPLAHPPIAHGFTQPPSMTS